jgi:hypothetical protein
MARHLVASMTFVSPMNVTPPRIAN